jgi:hypothetical protein
MSQQTFGSTLTSGIQDISAFLPILGTEQCERHVGSALHGGYLYAAATPLSLFGCLGIVKAAISVLIASVSSPCFHGAKHLEKAGFALQGSSAALIGVGKADVSGGYEAKRLLDALSTKAGIDPIEHTVGHPICGWLSWNAELLLATCFLSTFSMTPYIAIIRSHPSPFTVWFFPALRIIGSIISVITIQFVIQIRIAQILNAQVLYWRMNSQRMSMLLNTVSAIFLTISLWLCRSLLLIGVAFTAVGYIGCFTVVQNSSLRDTLIWLGLEAFLSVVRICIWGSDPNFDNIEHPVAITIRDPRTVSPSSQKIDNGIAFEDENLFLEKYIPPAVREEFSRTIGGFQTSYALVQAQDNTPYVLLTAVFNALDGTTRILRNEKNNSILHLPPAIEAYSAQPRQALLVMGDPLRRHQVNDLKLVHWRSQKVIDRCGGHEVVVPVTWAFGWDVPSAFFFQSNIISVARTKGGGDPIEAA